jgi:hypothetical protein
MTFRYKLVRYANGEKARIPAVRVRLTRKQQHQDFWAIIDSGADISVFSASIAKTLSIDVTSGKPITLNGLVEGKDLPAYIHQVHITITEIGSGVDIPVAFSQTEEPGMALLGQRGFFDNYQIRFLRFKDQIEVYPKSGTL